MYNSSETKAKGHGFRCLQCNNVIVANSTFEDLSARTGGAIVLMNMEDSVSEIVNNTFLRNKAGAGGAIDLKNPARLLIQGNNFTDNQAVKLDKTWKDLDAGALYYACGRE